MTDAQTADATAEPVVEGKQGGLLASTIDASPHQLASGVIAFLAGLTMIAMSFVDWMEYPVGPRDGLRVGLSGFGGTLPDGTEYGAGAPAAWSLAFGVLTTLAGAAILARRFAGLAGAIAAVAGAAGFVLACVYLIEPLDTFGLPAPTLPLETYFPHAGWALWTLFGASLLGSIAGMQAVALALGRDRPRRI